MARQKHHPLHIHHRRHTYPAYVTAFIAALVPIAQTTKRRWGTPVAVLVAQGALESSWGRHVKGNAYFGIKGRSPAGHSVTFGTHEQIDGKLVSESDHFRAYSSLADAADDYGRFLRTNKRYAACFAFSNQPEQFVEHLAAAGYATDQDYAKKIKSVMRAHNLARYDRGDGTK